ncbi:MAG: DUF1826 domain-containing protein [Sulfitobacter sp.]
MNFVRATVQDTAMGVAIVDKAESLRTFLKPTCGAAIWHRHTTPDFQNWVDELDPMLLPQGRVVLEREATRSIVTDLCERAGTPLVVQLQELIDDVVALAEMFADLMLTRYLRLRLAAVTSNACRKFHIDAVKGRLICTYRGLGTQYGMSTNGEDPARLFTVPTGAPVLLKGTLWPNKPASGLLHRSPPIEGTGETRHVLVLDALDEHEEDLQRIG